MGTAPNKPGRTVADVDALVDENGSPIEVAEDSELKVAGKNEDTVGATGPTNWWAYGLVALAIIIGIAVFVPILAGGPGSNGPSDAPVVDLIAPAN